MDSELKVYWRGIHVGDLYDTIPDMWYLTGKWKSQSQKISDEFESRVKGFDPKAVYADPTKGTRIILNDGIGESHALAMSLSEGKLFIRRVIEQKAVDWLLENVTE